MGLFFFSFLNTLFVGINNSYYYYFKSDNTIINYTFFIASQGQRVFEQSVRLQETKGFFCKVSALFANIQSWLLVFCFFLVLGPP